MTAVLITVIAVLVFSLIGVLVRQVALVRRRPVRLPGEASRRILFPFAASALSRRALDAALRLAHAEDAVLVPVFLARVPLYLPLDAPLPRQAGVAIPLQEAIEHRAVAFGVPVDARIERGRTYRHALRQTIDHEQFDRIVLAAGSQDGHGFGPDDVAWLLENAPGEIVVLRPGAQDNLIPQSRRRRQDRSRTPPVLA
ncbi:MAG TPA: universal stress protein [Solirubrobacteraceae bacterium]|jgi:nucleotide-binding universal stress UspA family protein